MMTSSPAAPPLDSFPAPPDTVMDDSMRAMRDAPDTPAGKITYYIRTEFYCFVAAVLFGVGNLINYISFGIERRGEHYHSEPYRAMDGVHIRDAWPPRRQSAVLEIVGGFVNSSAWLFFAIPMIQLAVVLSDNGKRRLWLHSIMATLAFGGAMSEFVARLMHLGTWNVCNRIADSFELAFWNPLDGSTLDNYVGWKALEIIFRVAHSMTRWVDAFEYLCLFGIFSIFFFSSRGLPSHTYRSLGIGLSWMGLLIGLAALGEFSVLIVRLEGLRTTMINRVILVLTIINRVVLLPLWLLMISCRLPSLLQSLEETSKGVTDAVASEANDTMG